MIATLTLPPEDFLQRLILDSRKHASLSNALRVIKRRVGRIRVLEEELEQLRSCEEQQRRRLHEILADDERLRQQFVRDVQAETASVTKGWSLGLGAVVPAAFTSFVPVVGKAVGPFILSFLKALRNG
jgi:translation initiation factor 2B subunit (eIF-2B alpha/beta/delta family)